MAFPTLDELRPQGRKIIEYMRSCGYLIRALNIVYLEGIDCDLVTLNRDSIDYWNDVRAIIGNDGQVLMCCAATTEPGWHYRHRPMNPLGAAQLAFGQYLDCWRIGKHYDQDALVQCGNLRVYRDRDKNGIRTGDPIDIGDYFGLNQHTTSSAPDRVGKWSAGCLVGRWPETHNNKFMPICRAMGLETFDTTLIDAGHFIGWCGDIKNGDVARLPGILKT